MCGITGFLNISFPPEKWQITLNRMSQTIIHRGPDDGGIWFDAEAGVGLAHRRLSIIDLSKQGHQPMFSHSGRFVIVYNGEIYNFEDIRKSLSEENYQWRGHSDTEVLLAAIETWGIEEALGRFIGMFAFAIYEHQPGTNNGRGRFFLARDRVGKKPLYYYHDKDRFVFASEIKAILAHPDVPRRMNRRVLPLYLAYGYVPAPHTMFENIYELPPGHIMTVENGEVSVKEYWDVVYTSDWGSYQSQKEIMDRLLILLRESVRLRLISDVPLGAFFSGGLDSTAIVACMAQHLDQPVKTFAIGFEDDPSFNELKYARIAARALNTDHLEFVVNPDTIDLVPKLVWHHDQPFADSSAIPTYLVAKLTRTHVTVALTGDGGDELFAGYERFAAARLAEVYRRTPQFIQAAMTYLIRRFPESTKYDGFVRRARRFLENAPLPLARCYLGWVGIFDIGFIQELLNNGTEVDPLSHFQNCFEQVQDIDPIGQLLYVNTKTYLPGDLLVKTDRMSMANSLEARSPFLDHKLLEFAAQIPSNLKLRKLTTKYILKEALGGLVPEKIIRRKKRGFGVPIGRWFRNDLKEYVRDILICPQALRRGFFREETLKMLIDEHQSGRRDNGHKLWSLITFEIWNRIFIDQDMTP